MRIRLDDENCSVARALGVLSDGWTMLLIREAFVGTRRFADFEDNLGISKNVLTQRLEHLVAAGVFERIDAGTHGTRYEYVLTAKGKDLIMVLTALRQWGDRWIFGPGNEPLLIHDRRTGRPIPQQVLRDEAGAPVRTRDLEMVVGPGASPRTRARLAATAAARR